MTPIATRCIRIENSVFRARQARDENKIQQIGRRFGGVQKIDDYVAAQQRKRDNAASVAHLRASSKTCPGCNRWVQRTAGCDHMTCTTSHCKVSCTITVVIFHKLNY